MRGIYKRIEKRKHDRKLKWKLDLLWYNWNTVQYLRSLLDNFFFKIIYRQIGTSGSVCSKNMYPFSASWPVTVLWGVGGRFPSGIRRLDDQKVFAFGVISVHKFFVRPSPNFLQIYFNFGEERRGGGVLFFKNSPVNKKYKKFFFVIFSDLWDLGNFFGPPFNRQKVWSNFWTNFENHRLPRNNPRFALIILETIAGEEYCTSISARLEDEHTQTFECVLASYDKTLLLWRFYAVPESA